MRRITGFILIFFLIVLLSWQLIFLIATPIGAEERGWLGVSLHPVTSEVATLLGLDKPEGALVGDVVKNGPAEEAGIKRYDIILEFNKQKVTTPQELRDRVLASKSGDTAAILIWRDGRTKNIFVKLGTIPVDVLAEQTGPAKDVKKIPLNVAVVIPIRGMIAKIGDGTYDIGPNIEGASKRFFSSIFDRVTVMKGKHYPQGASAVLTLRIDNFWGRMVDSGGWGVPTFETSISIDFMLASLEGKLIWREDISRIRRHKEFVVLAKAIEEMVTEIFKEASGKMQFSEEIRAYAATKSKPETMAKLHQEVYRVIKSDIDELPSIKAKPNKTAYAIVIGIENYRQKLPKADYATSDAMTVAEYLTKVMGYPEENVVTLLNDRASLSDITKYFEKWLPNNVEKDGIVFIYYSGHGAPNPKTGDGYLVPYDGDPTFIAETGYSLKRLYENLGKLQAREIIVALDSCFSGVGGRSVLAKGARPLVMQMETFQIPQKIVVLSAASGDQISSTYEEKGHGLFTYFMLKGIKGEGDTNGDGKIEIGELFDYIKPQVERIARKTYNNEQTPQLIAPAEKLKMLLRN